MSERKWGGGGEGTYESIISRKRVAKTCDSSEGAPGLKRGEHNGDKSIFGTDHQNKKKN